MEKVQAAALNTLLILEEKRSEGSYQDWSEATSSWRAKARLMAGLEIKSGGEKLANSGLLAIDQYTITTRYRRGITTAHRLRDPATERVYNIAQVAEVDRRWLKITAVLASD